jgi:hypothetical protein
MDESALAGASLLDDYLLRVEASCDSLAMKGDVWVDLLGGGVELVLVGGMVSPKAVLGPNDLFHGRPLV